MLDTVTNRIDPREYAMKYWKWIRVLNNNVQVWILDNKILKNIANGLYDAYPEDLLGFELLPEDEQPKFVIEALNTGVLYENVPFGVIDSGQVSRLNAYRYKYKKA